MTTDFALESKEKILEDVSKIFSLIAEPEMIGKEFFYFKELANKALADNSPSLFGSEYKKFYKRIIRAQSILMNQMDNPEELWEASEVLQEQITSNAMRDAQGDDYLEVLESVTDIQLRILNSLNDSDSLEVISSYLTKYLSYKGSTDFLGKDYKHMLDKTIDAIIKKRDSYNKDDANHHVLNRRINLFLNNPHVIKHVDEKIVHQESIIKIDEKSLGDSLEIFDAFLSNKSKTVCQQYTPILQNQIEVFAAKYPELKDHALDITQLKDVDLDSRMLVKQEMENQKELLQEQLKALSLDIQMSQMKINHITTTKEAINRVKKVYNKYNF
jgi:hypothetical protein